MSALLSIKDARRIALRQGLLAGTLGACVTLLSTVVPLFTFRGIYLVSFIAFFVAGWRSAKRTGRIDMGALAGFWAGVATSVTGTVFVFLASYGTSGYRWSGYSSLIGYISEIITIACIALLLGPAVGTLGGFVGKIYAEPTTPPATTPPSPSQPVTPSSTQQNLP